MSTVRASCDAQVFAKLRGLGTIPRGRVKPTVTFGSRAGFNKGTLLLPCFHMVAEPRSQG